MATTRFPAPGKLPKNTPLSEIGFTSAQLQRLTPAARRLTKGDLISLQNWGTSGGKGNPPDHLTIEDLNSLQKAYGNPQTQIAKAKKKAQASANGNTYCCCCCPCCTCTAAAEITPVRTL